MKRLLSLLSVFSMMCVSITTISCKAVNVSKIDLSSLDTELNTGLNFNYGSNIDNLVVDDIQELYKDNSNLTDDALESINNNTLSIYATSNGNPIDNIPESSKNTEIIDIQISVSDDNKYFIPGDYFGSSKAHDGSSITNTKFTLVNNLNLSIYAGANVYKNIFYDLAKLNINISSTDITGVKAKVTDSNGLALTSTSIKANTKYNISLSANSTSKYFKGNCNIQVNSIKLNASDVFTNLKSFTTDNNMSIYGQLASNNIINPNISPIYAVTDYNTFLRFEVINNNTGTKVQDLSTVPIYGDNYTVIIDATNSPDFSNKAIFNNIKCDGVDNTKKNNLDYFNLGDIYGTKLSFYDQICESLALYSQLSIADVKKEVAPNRKDISINVIDNTTNKEVLNDIPNMSDTYNINITSDDLSTEYFIGSIILNNVKITNYYDLSKVNISSTDFKISDNIYDDVREKLGNLIGITDDEEAINTITNDGVGIAIWDGSTLLNGDQTLKYGQTYIIKLTNSSQNGISKYFSNQNDGIKISYSKYDLNNLKSTDLVINGGDNIINVIDQQLGFLIGGSGADIITDPIGIAIWDETNNTQVQSYNIALNNHKYIIKFVNISASSYFTNSKGSSEVDLQIDMLDALPNQVSYKLVVSDEDAFDQISDQIHQYLQIPYSEISEVLNDNLTIIDENTNNNATKNQLTFGDTYLITISINENKYFNNYYYFEETVIATNQ